MSVDSITKYNDFNEELVGVIHRVFQEGFNSREIAQAGIHDAKDSFTAIKVAICKSFPSKIPEPQGDQQSMVINLTIDSFHELCGKYCQKEKV